MALNFPPSSGSGGSGGTGDVTTAQLDAVELSATAGFSFTGGFAQRDNPPQLSGADLNTWYRFDLDLAKQRTVDQPFWPGATAPNDIDLFGGDHLPPGCTRIFDFTNTDDADGHVGSIMCDQLQIGDTVTVRFDFYVTPSVQNTTLTYGLWFQTRNADDTIDFAFAMPAVPEFLGNNSAGVRTLVRAETTFYIASALDQNALCLPAVNVDQITTVEPISCLVRVNR